MSMNDYWLEGRGERAETGVLLIHGLTGTPNEMRILARGLNNAGFTVYAVQLAGHCGTLNDLLESTWQEWLASVRAGADKLMVKVKKLIVGGLSMGAVLALALATERPQQIAGVMALSTTFRHDGWSMPKYTRLAFILPYLRMLGIGRQKMFYEKPPYGIKDKALRKRMVSQMHAGNSAEAGLPGNPFWSVVEMQKMSSYVLKRLARVQAPSLVLHSSHDDIASVKNAMDIVKGVRHAPVQLVLLEDSYHMITIDRERRKVNELCINFAIERSLADENVAELISTPGTLSEPSGGCL
ncbi:TPA: alpha/beta fold hydrolase [Serratia marcescens]|uniref:alpha/beta hydrolase n=1 Tax=Serratia marcescens TaxID=615 RepID=UPI001C42CF97|nr:alpha/beta fold hydrolase [Serratia marcescens]EGT0505613.1 alpha/beta fold hydrolase [Serratia marcescens]MDP8629144.1 alpha/beta fold hydrolase [Serratia marcescens]MDP8747892.1 alpha/beta fold hydrolase [Serratia marcescens]MDP8762287.1 alpha/beta fold hydrolase [Serratia marcescens]HBH7059345.1 alpha/beta fold hydrolase [Serratia marcescens]